jgi:hypothetical protein
MPENLEDVSKYDVGYSKPPKHGQFQAGRSGNPRGRPKGSKNLASIVLRESRQLIRIQGPRGSRSATKLEAAVMQLMNKAAQGDLPSQRELFALIRISEELANSDGMPVILPEADQQLMQSILRRMENIGAEKTPGKKKGTGSE